MRKRSRLPMDVYGSTLEEHWILELGTREVFGNASAVYGILRIRKRAKGVLNESISRQDRRAAEWERWRRSEEAAWALCRDEGRILALHVP